MKKMFLTILVSFLGGLTTATAAPLYTYKCGNSKVTVNKEANKYFLQITYSYTDKNGRNHVINILNDAASLPDLLVVDDTLQSESLAPGSLAFLGFHYPNGQMYVSAEGETNEEGYIFGAEMGLIEGANTVRVTDVFWHDRTSDDVTNYSCTRIK